MMRILLLANSYAPSIGGYETVAQLIATELVNLGHEVTVVTQSRDALNPLTGSSTNHVIVRCPKLLEWIRLIREHDVYLMFNFSFVGLLPWLFARIPIVISHHGWYTNRSGTPNCRATAKLFLIRQFRHHVTCSHAVAKHIGVASAVVPNPYRTSLFRRMPEVEKKFDVVFLGRLVSDKGCADIVEAISLLRLQGQHISLAIIGDGPEKDRLTDLAGSYGVATQVTFAGMLTGEKLASTLNGCRLLVIPSIVDEGFGVVALEGLACGCKVIGTASGGLPEAIAACGSIVPKNDSAVLASEIVQSLTSPPVAPHILRSHLAMHTPSSAAQLYAKECMAAIRYWSKPLMSQ